jgi:hypothetical protein
MPGDNEGPHHPACRHAPPSWRNRFCAVMDATPKVRGDSKEPKPESRKEKLERYRKYGRKSWGYAGNIPT